jgi:hypothetical protein
LKSKRRSPEALQTTLCGRSRRFDAFLSHNGTDKSLVKQVAEELEKQGLRCWLDTWNLIPGDPWQPAIEQALGQCATCVVFFGPHGLGPWHNEEMRLALRRRVSSPDRKLRVLPVILPGGERAKEGDLPGFLQGTTWVEFHRSLDDEEAFHQLACGIRGPLVFRAITYGSGRLFSPRISAGGIVSV